MLLLSGDDCAPTLPGGNLLNRGHRTQRRADQTFLFVPFASLTHGWIVREAITFNRWGDLCLLVSETGSLR